MSSLLEIIKTHSTILLSSPTYNFNHNNVGKSNIKTAKSKQDWLTSHTQIHMLKTNFGSQNKTRKEMAKKSWKTHLVEGTNTIIFKHVSGDLASWSLAKLYPHLKWRTKPHRWISIPSANINHILRSPISLEIPKSVIPTYIVNQLSTRSNYAAVEGSIEKRKTHFM